MRRCVAVGRRPAAAPAAAPLLLILTVGLRLLGAVTAAGDAGTDDDSYLGVSIGSLRNHAHGVSGKVYAASEDTIFIQQFSYDGKGPDAFFWAGYKTDTPSPDGILLNYPPDASAQESVLQRYEGADIVLRLPSGVRVQDLKWLSIWCRRFTVNFGDVLIPAGLEPPRTRKLGEFSRLAHKVRSGEIVILSTKTFYIPNFHYDGAGPDAFFWVGNGSEPSPAGTKVPNERGSYDVLGGYMGQDIEITLPGSLTMYDIQWLAVWCVQYRHNFGWVKLPADLGKLPPHLSHNTQHAGGGAGLTGGGGGGGGSPDAVAQRLTNCLPMVGGRLLVRWGADTQHAYVQLSAHIDQSEWLGFGVSGHQSRAQMEGADVIVAFYDAEEGTYRADDYQLTQKAQCSRAGGVCPDSQLGGTNDAQVIAGQRRDGLTSITFKRPLHTGDRTTDLAIPSYGPIQVIAAIGTLNSRKEANYHSQGWGTGRVDFSAVNADQCAGVAAAEPGGAADDSIDGAGAAAAGREQAAWPDRSIAGVSEFRARIGPTGGRRGYQAVTGHPSWGVAWWINELLVPRLYVRRGHTYRFIVEGGDDPSNPAQYHPLYITDDPEGGYGSKNQTFRSRERVFAGVRAAAIGGPVPSAAGRLCEYVSGGGRRRPAGGLTFEQYRDSLQLDCAPGSAATLEWHVEPDTPDTVYYQCYTHRNLGWKIHVLSALDDVETGGSGGGGAQRAAPVLCLLPLLLTASQLL